MTSVQKLSAVVLVSLSVLSGCGPKKVEQCNAFIGEANKSQSAFVAISAAMLNPPSLIPRAENLEASVKAMEALKLKDAKLDAFRKQVRTLSAAARTG